MTEEEKILLRNMQRFSTIIRGQVIGTYSSIEYLIDDTIIRLTFNSIEDYKFYTKLFGIKKIDSKTKIKILKHCLVKYDKLFKKDTSFIREKISNITDKRHALAHWQLFSSTEGIELFKQKKEIKYFKPKAEAPQDEFCSFSIDIMNKLENDILQIAVLLTDVQKDLINLHQ